jgi:hypothetical protein
LYSAQKCWLYLDIINSYSNCGYLIQNPNCRSFLQFVTDKSDYKLTSTQTCQPNPWLPKWTISAHQRTLMLRPQDPISLTSAPPIFQWFLRYLLVEEIFATTLTTKFHQCVTRAVLPWTCGDFSRQLDEGKPDDNKEQEPGGRALPVREATAAQEAVEAAAAAE